MKIERFWPVNQYLRNTVSHVSDSFDRVNFLNVLSKIEDVMSKYNTVAVLVGAYTIGKERIFKGRNIKISKYNIVAVLVRAYTIGTERIFKGSSGVFRGGDSPVHPPPSEIRG